MNQQKYDIFISYRRKTGVDDARLLQQSLKARGYNVFFDYDSLRDGKFDERIYAAIEEAPIFILILSEGALDKIKIKIGASSIAAYIRSSNLPSLSES